MKNINLQDTFLNKARKDKISVTVFLVNGFQFKGMVRGFDNFTINLVDTEGRQNIVYKHAISTIQPVRQILLGEDSESDDQEAAAADRG